MDTNNKKVISLIRLARVVPIGDVGTEPTPAFSLAYLSSMVKSGTIEVNGIDASGLELNKFFKIPKYNLRQNGLEIEEVINLINPKTKKITGMSLTYAISYLIKPSRILRTVKSFFRDDSATVGEQRLKDHLRKSAFFTNYIKPLVLKIFTALEKKEIQLKD